MGDRFLAWVGVGVLTAGLSAGMLTAAGAALAEESTDGGTTSETTNSAENEQDSGQQQDSGDAPEVDEADEVDEVDLEDEPELEEFDEEEPVVEEAVDEESVANDTVEDDTVETKKDNRKQDEESPEPAVTVVDETREIAETRLQPAAAARTVAVTTEKAQPPVEQEPAIAMVTLDEPAATAAAVSVATAPRIPAVIRFIGTLVFNLYGLAQRLFGGPPILPANANVTVRSTTLRIECGCDGKSVEVPADWYFPNLPEGEEPERLIYLQHGFLAAGPWYSHTAAALAEQTRSIVVAPTITSNFFAADGCWLGAPPMHEGMAKLFDADNTALADSAAKVGYTGTLPNRVVLVGHSLGGGAVSGIAGYMVERDTVDRLAGVLLLDGVGLDDPSRMVESLKAVPADIPIYQLAAPVYMWNAFGVGLDALAEARPDQFIGVTLVGGSHVDMMRGGNPVIQFAQELVAGFTKPQNAAAARMLMVGWVNDMFAGTHDEGLYLEPGAEYSFETPKGQASVVALPNSLKKSFPLNFLQPFMSLMTGLFTFEPSCVAASVGARSATCESSIAA